MTLLGTETDTLPDGIVRTVNIYADDCTSIFDDGDWYGELHQGRTNEYGYNMRPAHFDGRARKIRPSQMRDSWWWQPPADVADEHLGSFQRTIEDLLDWGYVGVEVEVTTPDGWYGSASLWGIGAMDDEGRRYAATELTTEATWEAIQSRNRRLARLWNTTPAHVAAILDTNPES